MEEVASADASLKEAKVEIEYQGQKPPVKKLNKIFAKNGYVFSDAPFQKDAGPGKKSFAKPLLMALIAIGVFIALSKTGLASYLAIGSNSSLFAFLAFGVLAGLSSCAALVGGLVLSLSKQWLEQYSKEAPLSAKIKPHFLFNFGRLASFALLGALLGLLGEKFRISASVTSVLTIAVSAVMIILAMQMLGIKSFNRFRLAVPKKISSKIVNSTKKSGRFYPFFIGFMTFLLPCGFTLAAEGAAMLSGNPFQGALIMFYFTLGTMIPLMGIGISSVKLAGNSAHSSETFLKAAGLIIVFFVAYNLNFQFGISRYLFDSGNSAAVAENSAPAAKNAQLIKSVYTASKDIVPNSFSVNAGQPVRFEVNSQDTAYGCMSTIMVPGLWNKPKPLVKGRLIVMEFTPKKTGTYQITCAMGVPRGTITVK